MKQSYQSVLETLRQACENRPQVGSVDSGRELEFDIKKYNLWPRIFIKTLPARFTGRWEYDFEILCMDKVDSDLSNILDVMSLTQAILSDVISELSRQDIIDPIGITLTPLYSYQDAQASGWTVPLTLFTEKGLECWDYIGD